MILPRELTSATQPQGSPSEFNGAEMNRDAAGLLSQQIWCWGQDIQRADGNWLIELGFSRTPPPEKKKECASVYTLALSASKRVVLRGFGIFFGDDTKGGVFLERYAFNPQFTTQSKLTIDPWACEDLPPMTQPNDQQRIQCRLMLMELIEWIIEYETAVLTRIGIDYRRETLVKWNNGKRWYVPAERMTCLWRRLSLTIAANGLEINTPVSTLTETEVTS